MQEEERFEPRVDTRNCRRRCGSLSIVHNRREVDTLLNMMLAGMYTMSSALTCFIWPVSCHPRAENEIIEERQSIIPVDETKKRNIKNQKHENLVQLTFDGEDEVDLRGEIASNSSPKDGSTSEERLNTSHRTSSCLSMQGQAHV
ncbi:hypothetical protein V6N13_014273 [Hibiscus sabdariffa]